MMNLNQCIQYFIFESKSKSIFIIHKFEFSIYTAQWWIFMGWIVIVGILSFLFFVFINLETPLPMLGTSTSPLSPKNLPKIWLVSPHVPHVCFFAPASQLLGGALIWSLSCLMDPGLRWIDARFIYFLQVLLLARELKNLRNKHKGLNFIFNYLITFFHLFELAKF